MAAQNLNPPPAVNPPPLLQIPQRQVVIDTEHSDSLIINPRCFKVVIMQCTASVHHGVASVTLDQREMPWFHLPDSFIMSVVAAASNCPIQHLILKHHSLSDLPLNFSSPIAELPTSLSTLDLSHNCFSSLPAVVCDLVNLRELYLNNNSISQCLNSFARLKHLKALYLQNNCLKELPTGMHGLQSLEYLNIEHNELVALSSEISQLSNLKVLYANSNKIEYLPDTINELSNLQELYLSQNQLKILPEKLNGLTSLSQLQLANNRLNYLPLSFVDLKNLKSFTVSGNSLEFPPISACRAGVKGLMAFMKSNYPESCRVESERSDSGDDTPFEDIED